MMAALTLTTAGCSSVHVAKPTIKLEFLRPTIPAKSKIKCDDPVDIPSGRRIPQGEVVALWGKDRTALEICETRRRAAVDAVDGSVP